MCGIFGLIVHPGSDLKEGLVKKTFKELALLSESRGKDSSGLVFRDEKASEFSVFKGPITLNNLLKKESVFNHLNKAVENSQKENQSFAVIGHSRLATNGSNSNDDNNQPIIKNRIIGIHNGIIVNDDELWSKHPELKRVSEIDTEIMLALIRSRIEKGLGLTKSINETLNDLFGTVSTALFFEDFNTLALASNNRSLYFMTDDEGVFAFASEEYFLEKLEKTLNPNKNKKFKIEQINPEKIVLLNLDDYNLKTNSSTNHDDIEVKTNTTYKTSVENFANETPQLELVLDPATIAIQPIAFQHRKLLEFNIDRVNHLKRCTKCILPESFPFIYFDDQGVCNYCNNYKIKNAPKEKPLEEIMKIIEPYRKTGGQYDCIIPYSGGRDSTHTLHMAKKELGLNPIAFTYDWGMVTDLARRNIARVCGKLGVENIIVSADIAKKRRNINMNVSAWLKKPHLGMAPLFMAGDKYFFYYTDQVRKQTGLKLNIWGTNPLENTDFKVGFLGVPPDFNKKRIYSLSLTRQIKLLSSVGGIMAKNPAYLNSSLWDTIGSFFSRSIAKRSDYYHLYDYFRWDEEEIEDLVLNEYSWEKAIDTKTTWRIGDGTAAFYNYIYYTVAGFSEYDTFRSNQIREGQLTRIEALKIVEEENRPRYASLKWYLDIIGIDFEEAIKVINKIPKLYS